ncbi:unnamed protein product, partial [Prorocentrum cordatum]
MRLREWLFWHLSHGVRPIFLRWEGPLAAAQGAELAGPRERGEVVLKVVPSVGHLSSGFSSVMTRQVKFVHRCLAEARQLGCDFLLHLDDDELLCPIGESCSIPDVLARHAGSTARCIHFENWEAVLPFAEATSRPFSRPGVEFRTRAQVLYCNGKSAANLAAPGSVYCSGVHHFCRYNRTFSDICVAQYGLHDKAEGCCHPDCCAREPAAVVLHYDSPSLQEWRGKFAARAASKMCREDSGGARWRIPLQEGVRPRAAEAGGHGRPGGRGAGAGLPLLALPSWAQRGRLRRAAPRRGRARPLRGAAPRGARGARPGRRRPCGGAARLAERRRPAAA